MNAYAILRHAKIKDGRHLNAAGLHNSRGAHTPNADPDSAGIEVMIGTGKPHDDVRAELKRLGITKVRANGTVAVEVFLGASPDWWGEKGWKPGCKPSGELARTIDEWMGAQLAYLYKRFGDRLVSAIGHLDEASPHIQAFVVPSVKRVDKRRKGDGAGVEKWTLDASTALGSPMQMKQLQTDYAAAMRHLGLQRGEDRATGTVDHKPLKEWQAEQAELSRKMKEANMKQDEVLKAAEVEAERIKRDAENYAAGVKACADREAEEAAKLAGVRAEMRRRKEDASSTALAVKERELEDARREVSALRKKLERMVGVVDALMEKVQGFAAQYLKAPSLLMKQAIGAKGPAAARISSSEEARELDVIKAFLGGRGAGR